MTATREHLAGLELALERWNDGGPAIQYGKLLAELIDQAHSPEPVQGEAAEYQQLSRYNNWDRIEKEVYDLGKLGQSPERFRALYTAAAKPDAELVQCLKFARVTMATVAEHANLRGVEYRSLMSEIKRIDAKLAELKP